LGQLTVVQRSPRSEDNPATQTAHCAIDESSLNRICPNATTPWPGTERAIDGDPCSCD